MELKNPSYAEKVRDINDDLYALDVWFETDKADQELYVHVPCCLGSFEWSEVSATMISDKNYQNIETIPENILNQIREAFKDFRIRTFWVSNSESRSFED